MKMPPRHRTDSKAGGDACDAGDPTPLGYHPVRIPEPTPAPTPSQNFGGAHEKATSAVDSFHVKQPSQQENSSANVQGCWLPYTWLTLQRARCLSCGQSYRLSPAWDAPHCSACGGQVAVA